MNFRMIFFLLGHIMWLEAAFLLPAVGIAIYNGESSALYGLLLTVVILIALSSLSFLIRPAQKQFYAREGLVIVALAWITVSLLGALPFWLSGAIPHYIDAFFETVSGFTTTGASILSDVEVMPRSLLYWRSFTHWLGGMGVLVFLLAAIPIVKGSGYSMHLLRAESPGPEVDKLVPKLRQSAKILYAIYLALTALLIVLLLVGGMPLFDSICTAFGTAGTGGFGIKNDSIAGYSPYIQTVITIFMALFGINFNVYYLLLFGGIAKALRNEELYTYLGLMGGSILLITLNILPTYGGNALDALLHAAFQVSSIMTTTGFTTADFNLWPEFSRMILVILMVFGACAASTGGGIKISRLILLVKSSIRNLQKMVQPRRVKMIQMDGKPVREETIGGVYVYFAIYGLIAAISMLVISLDNFSMETNITAVLACLNNIGPGMGTVGPMGNYAAFSGLSKLVLTCNMLFGRLEIFPMLAVLMPSVWRYGKHSTEPSR